MNDAIKKEQLSNFAEKLLQPEEIEKIEYYTSLQDEEGDCDVWLLETDTGNEFWLFEGTYPVNIIKRSGLYTDVQRAYEAYIDMFLDEPVEVNDRFHYV